MSATVLVIEDNPLNRKLVRDVLGHAGYRVLEAADAEQGIAAARAERPDLVLMDIQLPGIDGIEALRRLRADEATAAIPVAALTAQAMKADPDKRTKLIDKLLNTSEYVDYWAYKWSDLFLVSTRKLSQPAMWSFTNPQACNPA